MQTPDKQKVIEAIEVLKLNMLRKVFSRGIIIKKLDKMFRQIMLLKRGSECEWCKKTNNPVYVSHVLPKGKYVRLRYVEENVLLLCYYCHIHKWHKNPHEAMEFVRKYKGEKHFEKLYDTERWSGRHDGLYLMALEMNFKNELERLTKGY